MVSRSRSRSPRRGSSADAGAGELPEVPRAGRLFMRGLGFALGGRARAVTAAVERVLRVAEETRSAERVAERLVAEANLLKGFVQKALQLMGDRADLMPNAVVRSHLRGLQSECERRPRRQIEADMRKLTRPGLQLVEGMKAGTIGEVSRVVDGEGESHAMKTVNPQSKQQFEEEMALFEGRFLGILKGLICNGFASRLGVFRQLRASIDFVFETVANNDWKGKVLEEFEMTLEAQHLQEAKDVSETEDGEFQIVVPVVREVSPDSRVLLMEWLDGVNLTDYIQRPAAELTFPLEALTRTLLRRYLRDLLVRGRPHGDLHPGNVLLLPGDTPRVGLLDYGLVLAISAPHLALLRRFVRHLHCERRDAALCRELLEGMGASSTHVSAGAEQFAFMAKSFDLVEGAAGLNLAENMQQVRFVKLPAWLQLLGKSMGALVITLQKLRDLPGFEADLAAVVRDIVLQAVPQ